jgi:hypothetical protein
VPPKGVVCNYSSPEPPFAAGALPLSGPRRAGEPRPLAGWWPCPNASNYAAMALAVGRAVKGAFPAELLVGPATAQRYYTIDIDAPFLTTLFAAGALEFLDGVTAHFYRPNSPEDVATEARELRALIDAYAPPNKVIPILSGEWGYSVPNVQQPGFANVPNETVQAYYAARMFLVNAALGINATVWYDWRDDYSDGTYEGSFGLHRFAYTNSSYEPYAPKDSALALSALANFTAGCAYQGVISGEAGGAWGGEPQSQARCYVSYWACPFVASAASPTLAAPPAPGLWPSFAAWCDAGDGWRADIAFPADFPGSCPWSFNVTSASAASSWRLGLGGEPEPRARRAATACVAVRDYLGRSLGDRCPTGDPPAYSTAAAAGVTYFRALQV